jgi:DNA-binding response OmpR family regulator
MDYDPEKFLTIFSNLISNAMKYTSEGGHIYVQTDQIAESGVPRFRVHVRDTGMGIPAEELDRIFDRFYQVENARGSNMPGTGIGLSITKELVKLLEGNIEVESKVGGGTVFIIDFPVRRDAETAAVDFVPASVQNEISLRYEPPIYDVPGAKYETPGLQEKVRILLIEDNADVASYVRIILEHEYSLLIEQNGNQGVECAVREVPDLIISDLMLPGLNGYDICKTLKHHEVTAHIPIILLTARVDQESKIEGFASGADAYIPKPFDPDELLAQVRQLIETRKRLQLIYQRPTIALDSPVNAVTHEDTFMEKVRQVILGRLDDATLNITALCRALGMSRTQLHNKIKAITGRSTTHFVRAVRLAEAQQLLENTDLSVCEIAYQSGFSDPGYFTRLVREEFDETPTDCRLRPGPETKP